MGRRSISWVDSLALRGPDPVAYLAVGRLSRPAAVARWGSPSAPGTGAGEDFDYHVATLLTVMASASGRRATARAAGTAATLWAAGDAPRVALWTTLWRLTDERSWPEHAVGALDLLPAAVVDFLLGPDPDCPHRPAVRLVAGLDLDPPQFPAGVVVETLLSLADDAGSRRRIRGFADVLSRIDHPLVLTALERVFARYLGTYRYPQPGWDSSGLTRWPVRYPERLVDMALANPHLPRAADVAAEEFGHREFLVFLVLRGRVDLVPDSDGAGLVDALLEYLSDGVASGPLRLLVPFREALRAFGPGAAREAVCRVVLTQPEFLERDAENREGVLHNIAYAEAVDAATDAGYLPSDPDAVLPFLLRSRQRHRLTEIDPAGEGLYELGARALRDEREAARTARLLLDLVEHGAPEPARDAARRALHDLAPGPAADHLCRWAAAGDDMSVRIVVEAGHLPTDPVEVPPLLYLTGQYERYDAADPDGTLLRTYCAQLPEVERWRLRDAAERACRPTPCPPAPPSAPKTDWPGGTGTLGSGGFAGPHT